MKTPLSSIFLILTSSLIGSFGAVFLKLGAEHMKRGFKNFFKNYWLATGVCFISAILCFFRHGRGTRRVDHSLSNGLARVYLDDSLGAAVLQGALHDEQDRRPCNDHMWRCPHQLWKRLGSYMRAPRFKKSD